VAAEVPPLVAAAEVFVLGGGRTSFLQRPSKCRRISAGGGGGGGGGGDTIIAATAKDMPSGSGRLSSVAAALNVVILREGIKT